MTGILGILNITRDSFSDGGRYLDSAAAVVHAEQLLADGADFVDIGARSSHPDSADVSPEEEMARLTPVVAALRVRNASISIDTTSADVMRAMLKHGIAMLNDINGFRDAGTLAVAAECEARLVVMHARTFGLRARRDDNDDSTNIMDDLMRFFEERIATLTRAGVRRERLILDPGMGFFLGANPRTSLTVLRNLTRLRGFGAPLLVSVSRKSFIGATLAGAAAPRPVEDRGVGTLATELWAVLHGADYVRTHDVRALRDALTMWTALTE